MYMIRRMTRSLVPLIPLLFSFSLFAAGRDISTVRYAPSDSVAGSPSLASDGNHFLTLWPMQSHLYGSLSDPSSGTNPPAFPVVPFEDATAVQVTAAGNGYLAIWNQQNLSPSLGTLSPEGVLEHRVPLDRVHLSDPTAACESVPFGLQRRGHVEGR
jgi:hypothetical protein